MSIPKVIHYCWFGRGKKSELMEKCIASWRKYCPDWEIIEWNETNFDVNFCPYAAKAYKEKRYGFLTDAARLKIIYENGGVYLDTDVELKRSLNDLLHNEAWFAYGTDTEINTGSGFGAVKGNEFVKKMLNQYIEQSASSKYEFCTVLDTKIFQKEYPGFAGNHDIEQEVDGIHIINNIWYYSIHYYTNTWMSPWKKVVSKIIPKLKRINMRVKKKSNGYISVIEGAFVNREKISIIIPAYNIVNEVQRCVDSILAQTYRNIEIIIVDDGSNDGTSEKLDGIVEADSRIRVIHKENGGVTKARLTGVDVATGEWIGFVDGDDYIEPDMYQRLIDNARKYQAEISHCGYQMVFPSRIDYYYNTGRIVEQDKITGVKDLLSGEFVEPGLWNKLFHKRLFYRLLHDDLMDFSIKNTEDLLMNYFLFSEAEKSVYEDFCPYHYVVRASSAANKPLNKHQLLDPLRVTERLMKETINEPELYEIVEEKFVRNLIGLASMDLRINKSLIAPIQKDSKRRLRKKIRQVVFGRQYSMKLKIMALWTCIWPASYRFVHSIYLKVTGLDKIYEIS